MAYCPAVSRSALFINLADGFGLFHHFLPGKLTEAIRKEGRPTTSCPQLAVVHAIVEQCPASSGSLGKRQLQSKSASSSPPRHTDPGDKKGVSNDRLLTAARSGPLSDSVRSEAGGGRPGSRDGCLVRCTRRVTGLTEASQGRGRVCLTPSIGIACRPVVPCATGRGEGGGGGGSRREEGAGGS